MVSTALQDPVAVEHDEPTAATDHEYSFDGLDVVFSDKIVLTPITTAART
jgi:hypothetical protein